MIQGVIIRIAPFPQSAHRDHRERGPSGEAGEGGQESSLEVLTPLFNYGGLIILIVIGVAR